jgi:hypothetical protein
LGLNLQFTVHLQPHLSGHQTVRSPTRNVRHSVQEASSSQGRNRPLVHQHYRSSAQSHHPDLRVKHRTLQIGPLYLSNLHRRLRVWGSVGIHWRVSNETLLREVRLYGYGESGANDWICATGLRFRVSGYNLVGLLGSLNSITDGKNTLYNGFDDLNTLSRLSGFM